ncbi:MAG: NAD+ synthase [Candidatus Roizmanbacteria bacterium]|nr:NAD+ synthase [Candidatus Roizmanbacteria bacterium]
MNTFNAQLESEKIISFLQTKLESIGKKKLIINWSGGIDSTVSLYLLAKAFPITNLTILHLPYETSYEDEFLPIADYLQTTKAQFHVISIKSMVDEIKTTLKISDSFRVGNVMARTRMITAYDHAKKLNALVCGTENRTEHLLGYFTRFGDEASDIEPIQHIYKTHIFELGTFLGVPNNILEALPSAGLWEGQTDEGEFGFSYKEADEVLSKFYDEKKTVEEIETLGFRNAKKIIEFSKKNEFKHNVPYTL